VQPPTLKDQQSQVTSLTDDQWPQYEQEIRKHAIALEDYDDDGLCRTHRWERISEHIDDVCSELRCILHAMAVSAEKFRGLEDAARWHDRGKTHEVFQNAIDDGQAVERRGGTIQRRERPEDWKGCRLVAKAPGLRRDAGGKIADVGYWRRYDWLPGKGRRHFRHELASALAVLHPDSGLLEEVRDLVAYLVAAHHGKVRLSIRSLPNEKRPDPRQDDRGRQRRFARGLWDGDTLPQTDLGGGVIAPTVTLSLEPMELGLCEQEPFIDQPSWAERMLRLRDTLGPFRLAFLEAILRAADMRASKKTGQQAATEEEPGHG
jgi:CRISPR-associated endonuclease/helicase Cas3